MPTFFPPLAHTSEVIVSGSSTQPYARLTFSLELGKDETVDGTYQLWTDLHNLDNQGKPLYAEGQWHEIPFTAPTTPSVAHDTSSPSAIHLPAILPPLQYSHALHAIVHIPARPASYSYTLRHVKRSGEVVWLGGEGSNGTVTVREGDDGEDVVITSGVWDESALVTAAKIDWRGVAVVIDQSSGSSVPHINRLPASETLKASLTVALGINPLDSLAFAQLSAVADLSNLPSRSVTLAVSSASGSPCSIDADSQLPSSSEKCVSAQDPAGSIVKAVSKAISQQTDPAFKINHSSESSIILTPIMPDPSVTETAVLLSYSTSPTDTSIPLSQCIDAAGPVLFQNKTNRAVMQATDIMKFGLEAGLVAEVLRLTEMTELRDAGEVAPIWICAPAANSVEVGEEEVGDIVTNGKDHGQNDTITSETNGKSNDTTLAQPEISTRQPDIPIQQEHDTEYEAEDEDDMPKATTVKAVTQDDAFWLFKMIDSIFYRLWTWIFGPLQSTESVPRRDQRAAQPTESQPEETPITDVSAGGSVETPANERTPLLSTPGLSRSTSSTLASALASPESTLTIKASQALNNIEYTKKRLSRTDDTSDSEPTDSESGLIPAKNQFIPTSMRGTVKIRSYAHFKFAAPSPFTFYVKQSEGWEEQLKFSFKARGEGKWREGQVEIKGEQGGAVEMGLEAKAADEGNEWDVQVERL